MERVAIYNRCSTEEENQKNALAIQAEESLELAEELGWLVVGQYVESQSGTTVNNRKEYKRLLEDLEEQKCDIVMVKSIDRLARNTKDWYLFLDCITKNGIRLYLYLERKFYVDEDALVTGIKAILAEEFSKELSKKIKNAHRRRQEKGLGLNITRPMYGWNKVGKDCYEVKEEEAKYIRQALELAKEGYGYRRISNVLYEQGARNGKGQRISETQWRNILRSPRIHGTVILNTSTYDFERKKRRKVPKEEWIPIRHALPEIVDESYHMEVLCALDKRSISIEGNGSSKRGVKKGMYPLSGKIHCSICGSIYYRTVRGNHGKKEIYWQCSTYLKEGKRKDTGIGCDGIRLKEGALYPWIAEQFTEVWGFSGSRDEKMMKTFLQMVEGVLETPDMTVEIRKREERLRDIKEEEERLLQKLLGGVVQEELFLRYEAKLKEEYTQIHCRIEELEEQQKNGQNRTMRMKKIKERLFLGGLADKAYEELTAEQVERIRVCSSQQLEIQWKNHGERKTHRST